MPVLREALQTESEAEVRLAMEQALAQIEGRE